MHKIFIGWSIHRCMIYWLPFWICEAQFLICTVLPFWNTLGKWPVDNTSKRTGKMSKNLFNYIFSFRMIWSKSVKPSCCVVSPPPHSPSFLLAFQNYHHLSCQSKCHSWLVCQKTWEWIAVFVCWQAYLVFFVWSWLYKTEFSELVWKPE